MKFLRASRRKNRRFFPCGASLSRFVGEYLSKRPNSQKTPCPKKFLVMLLLKVAFVKFAYVFILPPSELIKARFFLFLNMFYHGFRTWWILRTLLRKTDDLVVAAGRQLHLTDDKNTFTYCFQSIQRLHPNSKT